MSRFFAGSDSESETSSSEEEEHQLKPTTATARAFQFSDEEEETRRVVRSAKDKRYEDINNIIKHLRNHKKIKDMSNVLQDFELLCKAFDKAKKVVEKEGIPRFYIRCLAELEDFVNECWEDREGRKQMSKNNARGLASVRQKLRKYNRDFEQQLIDYRESPDKEGETEDEEEEEAGSDSDTGMPSSAADFFKKAPAKEAKEEGEEEDSEDDSSFWGSDSDESSISSDEGQGGERMASHFLKKAGGEEKEKDKDKEKKKKVRKEREDRRHIRAESDGEEEAGWTEVKGGAPALMEKPKMFSKDAEINHEAVYKKLIEIIAARGKKGTDRSDQIDLLVELRSIAAGNNLGGAIDVKILFSIIAAIYDYNPNIATSMKPEVWERCLGCIQEVLELLMANPDIHATANVLDDDENFGGTEPLQVRGCILTVVERMDEEFTKMLQACDAHSTEYVDRLKDETQVCRIIYKLQLYLEDRATTEEVCRVYLKRIQHMYYKYETSFLKKIMELKKALNAKKQKEKAEKEKEKAEKEKEKAEKEKIENGEKIEEVEEVPQVHIEVVDKKDDVDNKETTDSQQNVDNKESTEVQENEIKKEEEIKKVEKKDPVDEAMENEDSKEVMDKLCKYIYAKDNTDRIRTRAILCHIYHHALHDRWFAARDLMLMSHLQDTINHSDVPTQIMYNRGMVQLGLCAFRQGMIKDAHNALVDIQSGGRAKELLAQGLLLQRQHERTPEQEKIEKRRQMPYHMHINLELLECVYLVSAMLLEIPYMAAHEFDARRRMISKNFHHVMRVSDRQPLVGPPESMREHVVAASKAMKTGDWKACKNYIVNDKMNSKVWELFHETERVRDMMTQKIQEESLCTYLFTYSSVYDSLSMDTLAEMFELERPIVHSVISKMIINEELMASLDEPTHTVVMHRTEPRRLQSLALQLSEKVTMLVENNERIMEMKQGGYFFQKNVNTFQGGDRGNRGYDNKRYDNRGGGGGYRGRGGYDNRGGGGYGGRGGYDNRGYGGRGGYNDNRGGGFGGGRGGYNDNRGGGFGGGRFGNRDRDNTYGGRYGGGGGRGYNDRGGGFGGGNFGNRDREQGYAGR